MAFEPNKQYQVEVIAAVLTESSGGTPGLEIAYRNEDAGEIKDTLWLSEKARPRTEKTLKEVFGLSDQRIQNPKFWQEADIYLVGATCWITTYLDTYNGKERVKVQWVNKEQKIERVFDKAALAAKAAAMMGGKAAPKEADDDLPF